MRRLLVRGLLAGALLAPVMGCEDTEVPTDPTPVPPVTVTDTFSGTLNQNGAATFSFTVTTAGNVVATITSVQPDSTVGLGLSLGTWNGTTCQEVLANDNATQGSQLTGAVSQNAEICVRVRDIGKMTQPLTFTMTVVHP